MTRLKCGDWPTCCNSRIVLGLILSLHTLTGATPDDTLSSDFDSNLHLQQSDEVYDPSNYGQFSQSNPSEDDPNPYQNFIVQFMQDQGLTTDDLDDGPPLMLSRLGKRSDYMMGLGKRSDFMTRLGKRSDYMMGLGKRSDYMTRLGKRSDYMTRLGRSYMTRLGKRSADYMTRLGKRPNYMTRLGKRSSNYLTRLGKRSGPSWSQPEAVIKSEERRSPAMYDLMKFGKRSDLMIPRRGYRDWMTRLG